MSYSYSFVPNNVYGADALNEITKRLVTSGVEDMFEDGVPYNFSHLNTISSNLATLGIIPENNTSLKVSTNENTDAKYTVTIADGTAFFNDGSTITIYDEGETLPYTYGQKNYVYLHRDLNLNRNMPKVTLTEPDGDFVPLAEIAEDGTVTDTRVFAKGKLPGYMSDFNNAKKIETRIENGYAQIDLGGTNYKSITCFVWHGERQDAFMSYISMFYISNGKLIWNMSGNGSRYTVNTNINTVNFMYNSNGEDLCGAVTISDGIMTIQLTNQTNIDLDIYIA